jgi:uncharacterized protein YjdB
MSSNDEIVSVDQTGVLTGVSEGTATVTCILAQNTTKTSEYEITVAGDIAAPHVSFLSNTPNKIRLFEEVTLTAAYYENGQQVMDADIVFSFSGADEQAYTATEVGNTVTIKCWGGSVEPLMVTATYGEYKTSFAVQLEGI